MNTPAHLAASLFVWRNEEGWRPAAAVTFGAFLPDLPMFFFYAYEKFAGSPEKEIWSTHYFREDWQLFFDIFNSIPIGLFIWCFFRWGWKNRIGELIAASTILHLLCDLPLHHDDAHRHFLPISHWRFQSPISYWDPGHHGVPIMVMEFCMAVGFSGYVLLQGDGTQMRKIAGFNLSLYGLVAATGLLAAGYYLYHALFTVP